MKIILGKSGGRNIELDLDILLRTRLLVQANSGGGKSWILRRIAEKLFGKIQVILIDPEGEFACTTPETTVYLADGTLISARELKQGQKVLSFDSQSGNFVAASVAAISHHPAACVWELRASLSRRLTASENHKLLVRRTRGTRKFNWKSLCAIEAGEYIAIPDQLPPPLTVGTKWIWRMPKDMSKIGQCLFYRSASQDSPLCSTITFPKFNDIRLFEFLGYLLSDGHLTKDLKAVHFVDGPKVNRDRFCVLARELFAVRVALKDHPRKYEAWIRNKTLGVFLRSLECQSGRKARKLVLPPLVMQAGIKAAAMFLEAYHKCDSSGKSIVTASKTAAIQLAYLIERTGNHAGIYRSIGKTSYIKNSEFFRVNPITHDSNHGHYSTKHALGAIERKIGKNGKIKGLHWVKVESNRKIGDKIEVVGCYVPPHNNLVMGDLPLISHNTLREKFGYVLVGKGGETPADPRSAGLLAQKLLELRASAVCDLYEMKASERHRWVRLFLESLIDAPKKFWRPTLIVVDESHSYCLDTITEILTKQGWRKYDEIAIGDIIIGFNPERETYSYEPVQRVIIQQYDGEMTRLKSDGVDQLVTLDHRVVLRRIQRAQHQGRKGRIQKKRESYMRLYPWTFCEAAKIPRHIYIPIGGAPAGQGVPGLSGDLVRLLGWIITDGCFTGGDYKRYLSISQAYSTHKAGKNTASELALLLKKLGSHTAYDRKVRTTHQIDGREVVHSPSVDFYLGVELSKTCLYYLGENIHRIPRLLLEACSEEQLRMLWQGLLEGDGTFKKAGWTTFYPGKNEGLADDFQELGIRLGISVSKVFVPQINQFAVRISRRRHHYVRKTTHETYKGVVWDVTVPSGAFIARRNGRAFVTGNCPEKGAGESEASDAMIALATRGRKRGFTPVFATQRLGKLRKDAAAELLNVLIGQTFVDIDRKRAADCLGVTGQDVKTFFDQIKILKPGQFYALGRAISLERVLFGVGAIQTTHPEPGSSKHSAEPPPPPEKVKALLPKLADLPKAAEEQARTVTELKQEIRSLKGQLRAQPSKTETKEIRVIDHAAIERTIAKRDAVYNRQMRRLASGLMSIASMAESLASKTMLTPAEIIPAKERPIESLKEALVRRKALALGNIKSERQIVRNSATKAVVLNGDELIGKCESAILATLAQHGECDIGRLALLSGYRKSGGFKNSISRLRTLGYLDGLNTGIMRITEAGLKTGIFDSLPVGRDLFEYWFNNPRMGVCEKKIMEVLENGNDGGLTMEEIAAESGYAMSGGFKNSLSKLRTAGVIVGRNTERMRLSEELTR